MFFRPKNKYCPLLGYKFPKHGLPKYLDSNWPNNCISLYLWRIAAKGFSFVLQKVPFVLKLIQVKIVQHCIMMKQTLDHRSLQISESKWKSINISLRPCFMLLSVWSTIILSSFRLNKPPFSKKISMLSQCTNPQTFICRFTFITDAWPQYNYEHSFLRAELTIAFFCRVMQKFV